MENWQRGVVAFVVVGFIVFMGFASYGTICHESSFTITDKIIDFTPNFLDNSVENLFGKSIGDKQIGVWVDEKVAAGTNLLGYGRGGGQSFCLFFYDLGVGLLVGFWIWVLFLIYNAERGLGRKYIGFIGRNAKNLYLEAIGRGIWKIPLVGFVYAVFMQIPFLNAAIDIICFDFLVNGFWFDVIVRSILLAFYIGVGPTAYSEYKRYRMTKAYQYAVMRKKYQAQAAGAAFKA